MSKTVEQGLFNDNWALYQAYTTLQVYLEQGLFNDNWALYQAYTTLQVYFFP